MIPLVDILYNKLNLQPFIVNSLPKSGTNLLIRILSVFPGVAFVDLNERLRNHILPDSPHDRRGQNSNDIIIGVDRRIHIAASTLQKWFDQLKRGIFTSLHFSYSESMNRLLSRARLKMVLVLRDPRDVVVSHSDHVFRNKNHSLHRLYRSLSSHDRITASIIGYKTESQEPARLLSIKDRYAGLAGWGLASGYCAVFFENLVGERGGGSNESQSAEIARLADYLGILYSPNSLMNKIRDIYGSGPTFRKGRIGRWESHFSAYHKMIFKDLAGQLLIDAGYETDMAW